MKRMIPILLAVTALSCSVLAADAGGVYPAEVRSGEENGVCYLEKVYYLTNRDDPAAIPTADFERNGRCYTLQDILKKDRTETDARAYIEVVTVDSDTQDMAAIIQQLEPEREIQTEDGYSGTLKLDYTSITVEAAGYGTKSRTVTAQRTYPNLSDADLSLIPKSIEDRGRTLTLAGVDWQEAVTDTGLLYTASASYSGAATEKYATGYTVTADYAGEITKTTCDSVIYTAVFSSAAPEEAQPAEGGWNWLLLLPIGAGVAGLSALGVFLFRKNKAKKAWKEYTE